MAPPAHSLLRARPAPRLPLLSLLLVLAACASLPLALATAHPPPPPRAPVSHALPEIHVPIRPPLLTRYPRLRLLDNDTARILMEPSNIHLSLGGSTSLSLTAPRYSVEQVNDCELQAPAIILDTVCSFFSLEITNRLPFQSFSTCPAVPGVDAPAFTNGPENFEWTNIHTHGLRVDPGATSVENICEPDSPNAGFPPPPPTVQQYYCSANTSSEQICQLTGDNVLASARPLTGPHGALHYGIRQSPGATLRYTYPLEAHAPGVGWYHPHQHGSVGIQTPTSAAPLIIPESWLPNGLCDLYEPNGKNNKRECDRLIELLKRQPLEEAFIIQFYGIWFRNLTTAGDPDDDSLAFLGLSSGPDLASPLLYDNVGGTSVPKFSNPAGRDWVLVNGAFQPKIFLTEKTYTRWELLNTLTMKWLDVTFQKVSDNGTLTPAEGCHFWLLARDGVPLPKVPRRLVSRPPGASKSSPSFSDVILGPANRADVLVKCDKPGKYVLASGAGPFHTNPAACKATHCECFGDPPANGAATLSANNLYGGKELSAAVLAVVE
ncbi:hypothetical protein HYH03_011862, partial [Edaphochlamys debaryana]